MERKWNLSLSKVLMSSVAALLAATSAYAIPKDPCEVKVDVCCEQPQPGPFAFAYPRDLGLSCPKDFYIYADALIMQAKEEGLDFAVEDSGLTFTGSIPQNAAFPLGDGRIWGIPKERDSGDWNWGFRAGLGFYTCNDAWNIDLSWTFLHVKESASRVADNDNVLVPMFLPPNVSVSQSSKWASERWKMDFSTFDFKLGKPYHVSRYFVSNPFVGIRAAWIDQDILVRHGGRYDAQASDMGTKVIADNDFWGVGLRAGMDNEFLFSSGIGLFGTFSASMLFGKFELDQRNALTNEAYYVDDDFYTNVPNMELALGVSWSSLFSKDRYRFMMRVAYEFHYWWNQNQLKRFYDENVGAVSDTPRANLSLNGVSVRFQFDF